MIKDDREIDGKGGGGHVSGHDAEVKGGNVKRDGKVNGFGELGNLGSRKGRWGVAGKRRAIKHRIRQLGKATQRDLKWTYSQFGF